MCTTCEWSEIWLVNTYWPVRHWRPSLHLVNNRECFETPPALLVIWSGYRLPGVSQYQGYYPRVVVSDRSVERRCGTDHTWELRQIPPTEEGRACFARWLNGACYAPYVSKTVGRAKRAEWMTRDTHPNPLSFQSDATGSSSVRESHTPFNLMMFLHRSTKKYSSHWAEWAQTRAVSVRSQIAHQQ